MVIFISACQYGILPVQKTKDHYLQDISPTQIGQTEMHLNNQLLWQKTFLFATIANLKIHAS